MHHFLFLLILRQLHHLLLILRQQWRCLHHLVCPIDLTSLRHSPTPSMASDGLVFYSMPRPRLLALPSQPMTLLITMELVHTPILVLPVPSTTGVSSSCVEWLSMLVPAWQKSYQYLLTKHFLYHMYYDVVRWILLIVLLWFNDLLCSFMACIVLPALLCQHHEHRWFMCALWP